jgi:hypothetical protein
MNKPNVDSAKTWSDGRWGHPPLPVSGLEYGGGGAFAVSLSLPSRVAGALA